MGTSQYSSSFGRLQSISINFLSQDILQNLLKANDINDMTKQLESTWYGQEIKKAASMYSGAELLEVAFNRHLVETNKIILEAVPFSGKNAVRTFLSKWDLYNIELILSSKMMGRTITETESLLVSSRNVPAGIEAGVIPHDEIKIIKIKKIYLKDNFIIKFYQKFFSPLLGPSCRFPVSCSNNMLLCLDRFGLVVGFYFGISQVFCCHPWSGLQKSRRITCSE